VCSCGRQRKNTLWNASPLLCSPLIFAVDQRPAKGLPDKIDQHDHHDQHREGSEREPPGFDIAFGLAQQLAQARCRARHPEVEEVQAGQIDNGAGERSCSCAGARGLTCFEAVETFEQLFVFVAQGLEIVAELLHLVGLFALAADRFDDFLDPAFDPSVQITGA
jgi:hypothetical protein